MSKEIDQTPVTTSSSSNVKKFSSYAFYGLTAIGLGVLMSEVALAKFDIDAGVAAATSPVLKGLSDHWGKGILISGLATAMLGEGDLRQRSLKAGMGSGFGAIVVLGLFAMLG